MGAVPADWRFREFVSLAEAGRIVGRSRQWAAGAVEMGHLEGVRLPTGGPPVVTVASLVRLTSRVECAAPVRLQSARASLELIVNNG
jgi:hypothetical protein